MATLQWGTEGVVNSTENNTFGLRIFSGEATTPSPTDMHGAWKFAEVSAMALRVRV